MNGRCCWWWLGRGEPSIPIQCYESFDGKVAKWWLPDAVLVVDELPHTATGKVQKLALRERYRDHYMLA